MNKKVYLILSGVIFIIVSVLHLLRAILKTQITIGSWEVPIEISWVGFIAAAVLAIWGLSLTKKL